MDELHAKIDTSKLHVEEIELLKREGPKYQYGDGCLSDGILGVWMAEIAGLPEFLDIEKINSHLFSVYRYNFKTDLSQHTNLQRSGFAIGKEGGLLLCTWPKSEKPSLPFVYSDEAWTGIEYQVATHLIMHDYWDEGINIIKTLRNRYDGHIRNPYDEYECGHWYARALASYACIQAFSGIRYDNAAKKLYVRNNLKYSHKSFISTATGYGTIERNGTDIRINVADGVIEINTIAFDNNV